MHQLVNKNFDNIKMPGTTVRTTVTFSSTNFIQMDPSCFMENARFYIIQYTKNRPGEAVH